MSNLDDIELELEFDVMSVIDSIATTLNWRENKESALELINKFKSGNSEERFDDIVSYLSNKYDIAILL